jgi:hypothetical protein
MHNTNKKKKIGRNEKCPCNSGKKYKICCLQKLNQQKISENTKYSLGHTTKSANVQKCIDYLSDTHINHNVIDITDYLCEDNYKEYQIKNYNNKTIMVAERQLINNDVFSERGPDSVNIMVMYRGAYKCFDIKKFNQAIKLTDEMIIDRLNSNK